MKNKDVHKSNDLFLLSGDDLNKIIALCKFIIKLKPSLDETLRSWLSYLHTIEPQGFDFNQEFNQLDYDFPFENNDDFVNQDGSIEHEGMDDLIWKLGMNLPSWDDLNSNGDHDEK